MFFKNIFVCDKLWILNPFTERMMYALYSLLLLFGAVGMYGYELTDITEKVINKVDTKIKKRDKLMYYWMNLLTTREHFHLQSNLVAIKLIAVSDCSIKLIAIKSIAVGFQKKPWQVRHFVISLSILIAAGPIFECRLK